MTHPEPVQTASAHAVTEEDVLQVAALANLELTPAELPAMRRDLNAILGYIAQLNELDTAAVEPMAQVSEVNSASAAAETPLRQDVDVPSLDRGVVLHSAPETDGVFFKLPRVMER